MENTIRVIQEMTFCTHEEAHEALVKYGDVFKAVESFFPESKQKKKIRIDDTAIEDPEQRERCQRGRALQDKVNAVFSVAHSKTIDSQTAEPSVEALPVQEQPIPAASADTTE
jgi:hypothetical protein